MTRTKNPHRPPTATFTAFVTSQARVRVAWPSRVRKIDKPSEQVYLIKWPQWVWGLGEGMGRLALDEISECSRNAR